MIPRDIDKRIRSCCEQAYPEEACGLVVGPPNAPGPKKPFCQSDRVVVCTNVQDSLHKISPKEHPQTGREAYMMDPAELLCILSEMEKRGEVLKAIFHSHPDSQARFSSADHDSAVRLPDPGPRVVVGRDLSHGRAAERSKGHVHPGPEPKYAQVLQIVVSVVHGRAEETRFFLWSDPLGRFVEKE